MPHGGGHHGGGFGGGFHHHHHHHGGFHHRHHHHHGTGVVITTGGYYGYYRRRRGGFFVLGLVAVGLVIGAFVGLGYGIRGSYVGSGGDTSYSPGDTRLYGYSSFFCMGGDLEYDSNSQFVTPEYASLYLLPSKPPLKHTNSFYVNKTNILVSDDSWKHWSFYLYPGSKIEMSACQINGDYDFEIHLIKGNGNFNSWSHNGKSKYVVTTKDVSGCSSSPAKKIVYTVTKEDMYYMVLENNYFLTSNYATMTLHVNRTGYVPNGTPNCTGEVGCSYYTSDGNIQYALVTTDDPTDNDWARNVLVNYSCVALVANYVLVTVLPFLAVVVLCVTVVVIVSVCVVMKRKKRAGYQTLEASLPTVPTASPPSKPEDPPPPMYNPNAPMNGSAPPPPYAP